jgi:hypothetical protein
MNFDSGHGAVPPFAHEDRRDCASSMQSVSVRPNWFRVGEDNRLGRHTRSHWGTRKLSPQPRDPAVTPLGRPFERFD